MPTKLRRVAKSGRGSVPAFLVVWHGLSTFKRRSFGGGFSLALPLASSFESSR
nr:MAG TPA: hypothetical protein [Caudoviricetes sp.]